MNTSDPLSNPFSTRFVAPGQLDWVGPSGYFENLVTRWEALNCRAAIVGVHGAGKSTLLEHFVPHIADVAYRRDAEGSVVMCNEEQSKLPRRNAVWLQLRKSSAASMAIPWDKLTRGCLLILDGYEQLTLWRRATLIARTNQRGVQLLITSHRRTVLSTLCELTISTTTARQIVAQLAAQQGDFPSISDDQLQKHLTSHSGNMREVLMELYDQFEENRKRP